MTRQQLIEAIKLAGYSDEDVNFDDYSNSQLQEWYDHYFTNQGEPTPD